MNYHMLEWNMAPVVVFTSGHHITNCVSPWTLNGFLDLPHTFSVLNSFSKDFPGWEVQFAADQPIVVGSRVFSLMLVPSLQPTFPTKIRWIKSFPAHVLQGLSRDFRIAVCVRLLMLQRLRDRKNIYWDKCSVSLTTLFSNGNLSKLVLHGSLPAHGP